MCTSVMRRLTAFTVFLLLALAVGSASAANLSISNRNIRATWFSLEFRSEIAVIRCEVTLEGNFHSTAVGKTPNNLIGAITRAIVNQETCAGGRAIAFNGTEAYNGGVAGNTLPWHLLYGSFTGTLPAIASIRLLLGRFRFGIRDSGNFCTAQFGRAEDTITLSLAREGGVGNITSIAPLAGANIANFFRRDAGIICPESIELVGNGSLMVLGSTVRIIIRLI